MQSLDCSLEEQTLIAVFSAYKHHTCSEQLLVFYIFWLDMKGDWPSLKLAVGALQ